MGVAEPTAGRDVSRRFNAAVSLEFSPPDTPGSSHRARRAMTEISTGNGSATASAVIPDELVDLLIESVVRPNDPLDGAAVICDLLSEMCAAVEWLHGPELTLDHGAGREAASLRQRIAAGQDNRRRMTTLTMRAALGDRR